MCYEHMLTQDPERLLEDPGEEDAETGPERPEPSPEPDPREPITTST